MGASVVGSKAENYWVPGSRAAPLDLLLRRWFKSDQMMFQRRVLHIGPSWIKFYCLACSFVILFCVIDHNHVNFSFFFWIFLSSKRKLPVISLVFSWYGCCSSTVVVLTSLNTRHINTKYIKSSFSAPRSSYFITSSAVLQGCRVFQNAEFFAADHRLTVVTVMLHIWTRRILQHSQRNVEKIKYFTWAQGCAMADSKCLMPLQTVELWDAFTHEICKAAEHWFCFLTHAARLARNQGSIELGHVGLGLLWGESKDRHVRRTVKGMECHLKPDDLWSAHQALKRSCL